MSQIGFDPADPSLFSGKNDPEDVRWGERVHKFPLFRDRDAFVETLSSAPKGYVLAGYPDDDGVALSGGRRGAKEAPDSIRSFFYSTAASKNPEKRIYDLGNVLAELPLAERHEAGRGAAKLCLEQGHKWIGLGGGHDYGYADGAGFLDAFAAHQPVVINFDAHLDVRTLTKGLSSGTPFRRLIEQFAAFEFWEVGLLKTCNSEDHLSWARSKGAKIHYWEDISRDRSTPGQVFSELAHRKIPAPVFLSIDLDVLSAQYAPGCSQSWPWAMDMGWLMEALQLLKRTCDLRAFGFYEVAPQLDIDNRTSKAVAQLLHLLLQD